MTDAPPNTLRPTGYVGEASDDPLGHGPALAALSTFAAPPAEFDQPTEKLGELRQGPVETCCANAIADAILACLLRDGLALDERDRPSRAFLYREGLLRGGWKPGERMGGVAFSWMIAALNEAGYPTEEAFPYDPGKILAGDLHTPLAAFREAHDQKGAVRMHKVSLDVGAIKAHLLAGLALVAGVDTKILDPQADGAHAIRLVGWNGQGVRVRNPWGPESDTVVSWDAFLGGCFAVWAIDSVRESSR